MRSKEKIEKRINLLYKKQSLCEEEIVEIDNFFNNENEQEAFDSLLLENWEKAKSVKVNLKIEQIWSKIKQYEKPKARWPFLVSNVRKIAAILILSLVVYSTYLTYQQFFRAQNTFVIRTEKGEQAKVILPDGSEAWLNMDTRLMYNAGYGHKNRSIKVVGEAFLKVETNPEIPFIVDINQMQVKAIGTSFNVKSYENDVTVRTSLIEGKVEVKCCKISDLNKSSTLSPGESFVYNNLTQAVEIVKFNKEIEESWRKNRLMFHNASFDEVIKNTERWFDVTIKYNAANFKEDGLTVRLEKGETLERLLEILDETIGISYKNQNDTIHITKKQNTPM